MTHPTPSQQTTLVSAIYAHITRPPCDPAVYTYRGVRVVVKRYLDNGDAHIQTYDYKQTLPQAGIGGTTSFVGDKLVPARELVSAGGRVVANAYVLA